jgi:hypothetical protein
VTGKVRTKAIKKQKTAAPGPKPEMLKLKGNWRDALKQSLQKKKPKEGWPK